MHVCQRGRGERRDAWPRQPQRTTPARRWRHRQSRRWSLAARRHGRRREHRRARQPPHACLHRSHWPLLRSPTGERQVIASLFVATAVGSGRMNRRPDRIGRSSPRRAALSIHQRGPIAPPHPGDGGHEGTQSADSLGSRVLAGSFLESANLERIFVLSPRHLSGSEAEAPAGVSWPLSLLVRDCHPRASSDSRESSAALINNGERQS